MILFLKAVFFLILARVSTCFQLSMNAENNKVVCSRDLLSKNIHFSAKVLPFLGGIVLSTVVNSKSANAKVYLLH